MGAVDTRVISTVDAELMESAGLFAVGIRPLGLLFLYPWAESLGG
jgi:hypothetical protein